MAIEGDPSGSGVPFAVEDPSSPSGSSPGRPGASPDGHDVRRGMVFATVALALLMMSIDSTIVATALHAVQHGLGTSINWAGWTITAYSLGFVLMLPVSSKLTGRYGRRRVFLGSVVVFTAASLCCGLANDIYLLIVLRAIQAGGGAGFTPSATGIVVDHFGKQRDRYVGLFGSIFPIGGMIGPIFGGLFVSYLSWRDIFFVNVPIGALLVVGCLRYVPRDPSRVGRAQGRIDAPGMALLGAGLLGGMLSVGYLGESGAHVWSPLFVAPLAIGILGVAMFVRHVRRSAEPFIAPHLIYGPRFGPVNVVNGIYGGVTLGIITLVPIYAVNRYGIDALGSGLILTAEGIASIVISVLGVLALRRTGYRPPLYVGGAVIAAGTLLLAVRLPGVPAFAWLAGAAFLVGVGAGTVNPASRNAGLQLAPEHSATLAALRSMCMQIGSIAAVSIATAAIAKGQDPGTVQAWIYVVIAVVLVAALPIVARVPEHHGSW
ncbi:MAG: MFS transporter [Acidimicrobiales bacterium]